MIDLYLTDIAPETAPADLILALADALFDLDASNDEVANRSNLSRRQDASELIQECREDGGALIGCTEDESLALAIQQDLEGHGLCIAKSPQPKPSAVPKVHPLIVMPDLPSDPSVPNTVAVLMMMTAGTPVLAAQHAATLLRATGQTVFWTDVLTELRRLFPWVVQGMVENDIPYDGPAA
jgi:hypothetical protein